MNDSNFKDLNLENSPQINRKIFNKVGISKLNNFPVNHLQLMRYYDEISNQIIESAVSYDLLQYQDKWKEIALIRNWKVTNEGLLMEDSLSKLRSQFNTGIRYMSFYSAKPGLILHRHRDLTGNLIQGFIRLHIPIYTHPNCFYVCGSILSKLKIHAKAGNVYALDTGYLHGVINKSNVNRIHLLVELEVNEWMQAFLPKKNYHFFIHFLAFYLIWTPFSVIKDPTLFKRIIKNKIKSLFNR